MKTALITGITGQDGSYLSELLLNRDYKVHGIVRKSSGVFAENLTHLFDKYLDKQLFLYYGDVLDPICILNILKEVKPNEVYNLAAQSHVKVSSDIPIYTDSVTNAGAQILTEFAWQQNSEVKIYQASTSEMFGKSPAPQSEHTCFQPQSNYAVSKLAAYWHAVNFREVHNAFVVNGILFNHESPRRHESFVTKKIIKGAVAIKQGRESTLELGNLNTIRDWGYAPEYVEAMWKMLNHDMPEDFVIATGVGTTVREFCKLTFSKLDLNYENYVIQSNKFKRESDVEILIGNASKAASLLNWRAQTTVDQLIEIMLDAEQKQHLN
jgi:GDPmannose 4,6-dehydratase